VRQLLSETFGHPEETDLTVRILALDLERTLIDDTLSARPRPGLLGFLEFCHRRFLRVVLFTTVEEADAREVLEDLTRRGHVPPALLARLEYIAWSGESKDLGHIPDAAPGEVLLVDDDAGWVRQDQRDRWVPIAAWDGGADGELARVLSVLEGWLAPKTGRQAEPSVAPDRPRD
jgi:hypothetical protein